MLRDVVQRGQRCGRRCWISSRWTTLRHCFRTLQVSTAVTALQ